jgi:hypothetical protein
MANADWIRENGTTAQGKKEYVKYLKSGQKLSPKQAILANCYQCLGFYVDGRHDCEIPDCPLYPFMPYRKDKVKAERARSEKQMEHDRKLSLLRSGIKKTMYGSR